MSNETSNPLERFKKKTEQAMAKIQNLDEFRASDPMVDYVFKIGRQLFERPLDVIGNDWLTATGGKLTGAYAYLGSKSAYARAERDVYEQKLDEVKSELLVEYLGDDYKVTQARAVIAKETSPLIELVIQKELEKNSLNYACSFGKLL